MPLSKGCSKKSFSKNVRTLAHERPDMSPKQRVAVAFDVARRSGCAVPHNPNRVGERPVDYMLLGWDRGGSVVRGPFKSKSMAKAEAIVLSRSSGEITIARRDGAHTVEVGRARDGKYREAYREALGRRNRLDQTISKDQYDEIRARIKDSRTTNDERALVETYEWIHHKPEATFLYYNEEMTEVRGFMGNKLGDIVRRGPEVRRMGGKTQSVQVLGTNGVRYHGICNKTGGTYCRLRRMKGR